LFGGLPETWASGQREQEARKYCFYGNRDFWD